MVGEARFTEMIKNVTKNDFMDVGSDEGYMKSCNQYHDGKLRKWNKKNGACRNCNVAE